MTPRQLTLAPVGRIGFEHGVVGRKIVSGLSLASALEQAERLKLRAASRNGILVSQAMAGTVNGVLGGKI